MTLTYLHPTLETAFAAQVSERPPTLYLQLALSPTNYYSLSIEADMTILPTRYAFEPSFLEAHGGWFVDSVGS